MCRPQISDTLAESTEPSDEVELFLVTAVLDNIILFTRNKNKFFILENDVKYTKTQTSALIKKCLEKKPEKFQSRLRCTERLYFRKKFHPGKKF
jgi:hypothetical protein